MASLRELLLRCSAAADESLGTWFFPAAIVFIGLGALVAALLIPPGVSNLLNFSVLKPAEGLTPSAHLRWIARGWFALALVSALCFWLYVHKMSEDVKAQSEENKTASKPAVVTSEKSSPTQKSELEIAIEYYESQGFEREGKFESENGREALLFAKTVQNADNFWHRKGVLLYPDGFPLPFTVGILHSGDSWKFKSERLVNRQNFGRPVKIETALRRPLIKQLADEHDYLLTIGLASTRDGSGDPEFNENLSGARAYNAAYAAWKLELMPYARIRWIHLGYAKSNARNEDFEALQRSVVLVGMVAEKQIFGKDVVVAATKLITLDGVNLADYSVPITALVPERKIHIDKGYKTAKNFFGLTRTLEPLVLSPNENEELPENQQ